MIYMGIDNGSTGSIAVLSENGKVMLHIPTPVKETLSYTKKAQYIKRVDTKELSQLFGSFSEGIKCLLERPMINPGMFKSSISSIRADEATVICLENAAIPYAYIDSKKWQKELLPQGLNGRDLKKAAKLVSEKVFAGSEILKGQGMQDSLLIAEYLRRKELGALCK